MAQQKTKLRWLPAIVWACFIFFMSAHSGGDLSSGMFGSVRETLKAAIDSMIGYQDDPVSPLCRFLEYLILGLLVAFALKGQMRSSHAFLLAVALASVYGVTDEIHQLFVPGRFCGPADWATDTCGAILGAALVLARSRSRVTARSDHATPAGSDDMEQLQ